MRERDIEKILTEEVKREGGRAYKLFCFLSTY